MKKPPKVLKSARQAFKLVTEALAEEELEFSANRKDLTASIPMMGPVQPYDVFVAVTPSLLLLTVPYFPSVPRTADRDQRLKLYEKLLVLNDSLGVVKFSYNRKDRNVILSVEIPWRDFGLTPRIFVECFYGLIGVASDHQRAIVSAAIELQPHEDREKVAGGNA